MQTFLRALRLYAMVAWVGGLAFFAFVVAPVAFGSLASAHEAGIVVGGTLRALHWIGVIGGGGVCSATRADGGDAGGNGLLAVQDSAGDGGGPCAGGWRGGDCFAGQRGAGGLRTTAHFVGAAGGVGVAVRAL